MLSGRWAGFYRIHLNTWVLIYRWVISVSDLWHLWLRIMKMGTTSSSADAVHFMGVEFSPLFIPLKRRLETTAVLFQTGGFVLFPPASILFFIYLLFTDYYWMAIGYAIWTFYDVKILNTSSRGGRRWEWLRYFTFWRYFRDYFPISLVKTADLPPRNNYLLAYHPHGIISCGAFGNFATEASHFSDVYPGIRPHLLTLAANFRYPLIRGLLLWMGW